MAVYSYHLTNGATRWFFVIDLPADADGRRRQHKRQGFPSQAAALKAEEGARSSYGGADLNADGTVAAELQAWLGERELDVQETTLSNYRDVLRCYVVPHIGGRQLYASTSGSCMICTARCSGAAANTARDCRRPRCASCTAS